MKKIIISFLIILLIVFMPVMSFSQVKEPTPPTPTPEGGEVGGGGAPIGSGLFILLGFGAVYGGKKVFSLFNKNNDEN
jgi:amino acid transporter